MNKYGSKNKRVYTKSSVLVRPPPMPVLAPIPEIHSTPMRSIISSNPVNIVLPRVESTPLGPRAVKAPFTPMPCTPCTPVIKPIHVVKSVAKPKPVPVPVPVPEPAPLPEPPTGSRAWKIHQFIKANFKC